jgi:hypothetical protein
MEWEWGTSHVAPTVTNWKTTILEIASLLVFNKDLDFNFVSSMRIRL